ncbi:unnamed protein product [Brassica napus]|uniref:(rape) hypothetical protein n=1 Tax=Brassica napus TaxID=3708 RepID=A0A816KRS2_BRANA|nr:unnamed protein product [Brassica napus]
MFQAQLMEFHRKLRPKKKSSFTSFLPNREIDGSITVYSDCCFESVKQEDQKCNKPLSSLNSKEMVVWVSNILGKNIHILHHLVLLLEWKKVKRRREKLKWN